MHQQMRNLILALRDFESNKLLENMSEAEVRRNTAQFIGILSLLGIAMILLKFMGESSVAAWDVVLFLAWAIVYLGAAITVYFVDLRKLWCVRLSLLIIIIEGVVALARWAMSGEAGPGESALVGVLVGLTMGAALLPWSPRQTLTLSLLWIITSTITMLLAAHPDGFSVPAAIFSYIAVTIPGTMISFFRMSRFQDQFELHFIQSKYDEVREDLQAAKSIHERGFPKPKSSGEIRFTYVYRPMSQIGGDSVFATIHDAGEPNSAVTLVLFDVTGHGISAALTANRLQGELMRLTGEDNSIEPGELLSAVDRYVCLTLADSAVLVSAVAIRVDPSEGVIRVANAGHPAPILRDARGQLTRIQPSGTVLGVGVEQIMQTQVEEFAFNEGDSLIAYTDGVSEARIGAGQMFDTAGVEGVLSRNWVEQSKRWPVQILEEVEKQRAGDASDDILIVEIYRA
ncbi:MAG: serine/threonine-protein phosphatase [Phycisphaerales bacterium]|nr:serine/threonine-protein phosphatase [Phycisphaerales bacterium]